MKFVRTILLLIACLISIQIAYAQKPSPTTGLRIRTYPYTPTEFTSVLLDNGEPIDLNGKEFRIEMDVWAYNDNPLGSLCRIVTDKGNNVDLMYGVGADNVRYPLLMVGDVDIMQQQPVTYGEWTHVVITLSPHSGRVMLDYGGQVSEVTDEELKGTRSVRVALGLCRIPDYLLLDIASVAVKDLQINRGGKSLRHWKMHQHSQDVCYDELEGAPAVTENPQWIIDDFVSWKKIYSRTFPYFPSIAFDPIVASFYMAYHDNRKLYVYHAPEGETDSINITGGEYAAVAPNQMMYIRQLHTLLSYNLDTDLFARFDPMEHCWINTTKPTGDHDFWNNTTVYNPADSSLISFGGYGHYRYKNLLIKSYPFDNKPQERVTLKDIDPRYSCSSVLVDSILYIFGERGCASGRQEVTPHNYYDLYAVNIKNYNVSKLWDRKKSPLPGEFVPGENMVYDADQHCLYAILNYGGGALVKIDIATGEFELMSLSMNQTLDTQTLYLNLYFSAAQKKFYAAYTSSDVDGHSTVGLFELDYPPLPISTIAQISTVDDSSDGIPAYIWVLTGIILAAGGWIAYRIVSRRARKTTEQDVIIIKETVETPVTVEADGSETQTAPLNISVPEASGNTEYYKLDRSCIRFFGGFRAFNKDGEDITHLFTPTLKQLLILLVLYTGQNPMGIPNNKLLSLLWNDKEEEAAKNNRNVYMSRLRNLLSQIGDVSIQTHKGFRNISFEGDTVCDYLEAMRLFENTEGENLNRLLELLFNGMMLPNVELDFVDSFKSEFSNKTLDLLCRLLRHNELPSELRMKIADTLFQHDFINEDALRVKCSILHQQGRTGLAQTVYATFCKEYKSLMGYDYPHPFAEIVGIAQTE